MSSEVKTQRIKIFLASSFELKPERERLEIEIYRKCKAWFEHGIFLHLDIWEDLSAAMGAGGSQNEYNKFVEEADLFILLVYTKVGMYTAIEFEKARGKFQATKKPFIFTYFKNPGTMPTQPSLQEFHDKLKELGHFYSPFEDANDLWNQFNKELERLEVAKFEKFERGPAGNVATITGDGNFNIQQMSNSNVSININAPKK